MTTFTIYINGEAYFVEAASYYNACAILRDELSQC